jgi:hypothetical protein
VLDRALRGVRRDLARLQRDRERLDREIQALRRTATASARDLQKQAGALEALDARVDELAASLTAVETQRDADRAEAQRRAGDLTRALVIQSRAAAGTSVEAKAGRQAVIEPVLDTVIERRLTFLPRPMLRDLADVVLDAELRGLPGLLVETGCAKGGSAIVLAAAKSPERPMRIYDVFGMIPPPGERDTEREHARYEKIKSGRAKGFGSDLYYGYEDDLLSAVIGAFQALGLEPEDNAVSFVRGLFQDTLHGDEPVAVAHLDGDWYESTLVCLERLGPRIVPGGRIVLDDYDQWEGCRKAVDEWLPRHPEFGAERRSRLHVVRAAD